VASFIGEVDREPEAGRPVFFEFADRIFPAALIDAQNRGLSSHNEASLALA
jgi:hypothetical protein